MAIATTQTPAKRVNPPLYSSAELSSTAKKHQNMTANAPIPMALSAAVGPGASRFGNARGRQTVARAAPARIVIA